MPAPNSPEMKSTRPATVPDANASPRRDVAAESASLSSRIKAWGRELGFQAVGIADADLSAAEPRLLEWLAQGWHGEMEYMARHGALRARPAELKPGTLRVISCRMNYLNDSPQGVQEGGEKASIARYARGRDYHKVLRDRLQKLCERIAAEVGDFGYRVFTDSAPVMEVELAARAASSTSITGAESVKTR